MFRSFFFFNDTATTEIYTLSLHDALPICTIQLARLGDGPGSAAQHDHAEGERKQHHQVDDLAPDDVRSEEHTSELQSRLHLVCRLLLEKKKKKNKIAVNETS